MWRILRVATLNTSFPVFPWFFIYWRMVSSVTLPTVEQKYPLPHKCWPQYYFFNFVNCSCNILEDRPLRYCTILLVLMLVHITSANVRGHFPRSLVRLPFLYLNTLASLFLLIVALFLLLASCSGILLPIWCGILYHTLHGYLYCIPLAYFHLSI